MVKLKKSIGNFRTSKTAASVKKSRTKRNDPGRRRSPSQNKIMDDNDAAEEHKVIGDQEDFERHTHPTEDDTVRVIQLNYQNV